MKRPTLPRSAHHYGLHPDTLVVHPDYAHLAPFLRSLPQRMARGEGEVIHRGRNELRIMHYDGLDLVVKAFHRPHVSNRERKRVVKGTWVDHGRSRTKKKNKI